MGSDDLDTDVVIIGAGPVGLFGAYYAGFRGLRCAVVDSLPQAGGQITAMYPEKFIGDVAGFPAVRGRDLVEALVAQAAPFSPKYVLGETATSLNYGEGGCPEIRLSSGRTVQTKAVVITAGVGKFVPRPLPVGEEFRGHGLEHFVPDPQVYCGHDVVIVGGGDSAIDWAHALHPVARSVTLVHRRERFRAHEYSLTQLRESPVRILTSTEIAALRGDGRVQEADVVHVPTQRAERIATDAVIAALGFVADLGPLAEWGIELQAKRIVVSTTMATNLPRVFAAGDVTAYPGKVRLIAVGFGEVALAVNNAAVLIDPSNSLYPGHSTDAA